MKAWLDKLTETFLTSGYYKLMLEGLGNTVIITLGALVIGVVIGALIATVSTWQRTTGPWPPPPGSAMPM